MSLVSAVTEVLYQRFGVGVIKKCRGETNSMTITSCSNSELVRLSPDMWKCHSHDVIRMTIESLATCNFPLATYTSRRDLEGYKKMAVMLFEDGFWIIFERLTPSSGVPSILIIIRFSLCVDHFCQEVCEFLSGTPKSRGTEHHQYLLSRTGRYLLSTCTCIPYELIRLLPACSLYPAIPSMIRRGGCAPEFSDVVRCHLASPYQTLCHLQPYIGPLRYLD
ncbi:hypothetical protein F5Y06DRAFT_210779 [Hypoxylon sp. FL0890]|nr:hypothetical protein F5Y06DRAFT_210779 [Hypoxylon sp. FL0890]